MKLFGKEVKAVDKNMEIGGFGIPDPIEMDVNEIFVMAEDKNVRDILVDAYLTGSVREYEGVNYICEESAQSLAILEAYLNDVDEKGLEGLDAFPRTGFQVLDILQKYREEEFYIMDSTNRQCYQGLRQFVEKMDKKDLCVHKFYVVPYEDEEGDVE